MQKRKYWQSKTLLKKKYPEVTATIKMNEWQKNGYHRLYIDLSCKAIVNGEEKEFVARFGFVNLKTNRYSHKGTYDMQNFNVSSFAEAKMLHDYANAYQDAVTDKNTYTPNVGYREIFGLSAEEMENGISREEMLNISFENGVDFENLENVWVVIDCDDVVAESSDFGGVDKMHGPENVEFAGSTYRVLQKYGKNPVIGEAVKIGDHFNPFGAVEKYRITWENNKIISVELAGEKIWRVPK